jgi:hypothetical protein
MKYLFKCKHINLILVSLSSFTLAKIFDWKVHDSATAGATVFLGDKTHRNDPICVALPKVAKTSRGLNFRRFQKRNFADVNTSLLPFILV